MVSTSPFCHWTAARAPCERETLMPTRVEFAPVEGAAALFTPAFCEYLTRLHIASTRRPRFAKTPARECSSAR